MIRFEMSIRQQLADNGPDAAINFCMSVNNCTEAEASAFVRTLHKWRAIDSITMPYNPDTGKAYYR